MASDIGELLRSEIARRADLRCEYCLISEADAGFSHQVDHIVSRKHGGLSVPDNLAFACVICNRYKGTDVASVEPGTGNLIRLFNPRLDDWHEHFVIRGANIEPLTAIAVATVQLLRMNAPERLMERRALQALGRYPQR